MFSEPIYKVHQNKMYLPLCHRKNRSQETHPMLRSDIQTNTPTCGYKPAQMPIHIGAHTHTINESINVFHFRQYALFSK